MLLNTMERGREVRRRGSRMSGESQKLLLSYVEYLGMASVVTTPPLKAPQILFFLNQKVSGFKRGKEKVRACSRLIAEMVGSSGSEEEEEQQQQQQRFVGGRNHRIKLNGKAFIERGAVDTTAVPRKLRSVTIKRNRESMTSALMVAKKQRQVSLEETSQSNKVHKSKIQSKTGARDRSSKQLTTFLVTKDEEDVAEALFALARVFPCDKISKKKANRKKTRAKFEYLTEIKSDYSVTLEAIKEDDSELPCFSGGDGQTNDITVAHDVSVKLEPAADSSFTKESHLSANGSLQFDLEKIPASPAEECDEIMQEIEFANVLNPVKESCNTYLTCLNSYNENRFLEQIQNVSSIQETENNLRPISFPCSMKQEDVQPLKKDYLQIGVDFASISNGFAGKFCNGYDIGSESLKCEKSNALPFSVNSFANPLSNVNKASKDQLDIRLLKVKKSWKKCATHVHITQLIKKYIGLEKNDQGIPILDYERKGNGGSISGSMTFKNEVLDFKNYLNHSILRPNGSSTGKCLQEERKDQFQDNQHVDDLLALNTFSSLQQNQTRDFFSLTPGCISTKTSINEHNHPVNLVDSSMQAQLSCSHQSRLQRQIDFMPPPQTSYRSGYPDLMPASTSQQVQLQKFLTSQYLSNVPAAASKQHHHSSQLQHWGHHRPANMLPFSPKWQNGVHHDSFFAPSGLHMANMRPPSLDAFGVKFPPHQQLFPNISSPSVGKRTTQTSNADHHACLQQLLLNTQHS